MPKTTDATKILDAVIGDDPSLRQYIEEDMTRAEIGSAIYELRNQAGMTQTELARRIGTTQSVISRLEDTAYERYSLSMLHRIAKALNRRVQVQFVPRIYPEQGPRKSASSSRRVAAPGRSRARKTLTLDQH